MDIPAKRWRDTYRVKVRGKSSRMVWVSNLSKSSNKQQIAKLNPKSIPRNSSVNERVYVLKNAVRRPKKSYSKSKKKTQETHTFERMPQAEVFPNLSEALRSQKQAFKVAIELGYNLINIQTGEKRYYSPSWNTRISEDAIAINKKTDIQTKIIDIVESTDFASKIKYPSSAYKLNEITAVSARLFYRDHRLGDSTITIPEVIKNNQHIINFPTTNDKCVFHCIAYHLQTEGRGYNRIKALVEDKFKQYCAFKVIEYSVPVFKSFEPIDILEFDESEECFDVAIDVHEMNLGSREMTYIRESDRESSNKINILDYNGYAMYIPRIDALSSKYPCDSCDMIFGDCQKLADHKRSNCQVMTREVYCHNPTNYKPAQNKMKGLSSKYKIKEVDYFMDHFILYDFEAILKDIDERRGVSTEYTTEHIPPSVSVCDSLTNEEKCFVSDDRKDLLTQMFKYIHEIANNIYEYNTCKFGALYKALEDSENSQRS